MKQMSKWTRHRQNMNFLTVYHIKLLVDSLFEFSSAMQEISLKSKKIEIYVRIKILLE